MKYVEKVLKTFLVVAEEKSISRAAMRLKISQSAVTKHLQALETELGPDIFVPNTIPKQLSEKGWAYYSFFAKAFKQFHEIKDSFLATPQNLTGTITLCYSGTILNDKLFKSISEFTSTYPLVHFDITSENYSSTIETTNSGIFMLIPSDTYIPDAEVIKQYDSCTLGILISKGLPRSNKTNLTLSDINDMNIVVSHSFYEDKNLKQLICDYDKLMLCDDFLSMLQIVNDGSGIGIVPLNFKDRIQNDSLKVIPLLPSILIKQQFVFYGFSPMTLVQKTFIKFLN